MQQATTVQESFNEDCFDTGETIVIGVSGGADSMVLLERLISLRVAKKLTIHVVHVNYGTRGENSDLDEQLVRDRCKQLDVFLTLHRADDLRADANNFEERAREIRHKVFRETAEEAKATKIVVGHTLDDQVETVLLRLLRGSGLQGLGAMRMQDGLIVRPMLNVTRKQVRDYAKQHSVIYRDDSSNKDMHYLRNRVRHILLPLLVEHFNPNIRETLRDTAALIRDDEVVLQELSQKIFAQLVKKEIKDGKVVASLRSAELLTLPLALQRRVMRSMIQVCTKKKRVGFGRALGLALKGLQKSDKGVSFPLGEGLTLTRKQGIVSITFANSKHRVSCSPIS